MLTEDIRRLVKNELAKIAQRDLLALAKDLLISPRLELREWDYGVLGTRHECWVVLEHSQSNTAIAYCSEGFGPMYPWGLLFLSGEHMSMGMDSGWFASLEDALRNCSAWEGQNPLGYEIQ